MGQLKFFRIIKQIQKILRKNKIFFEKKVKK